MLEQLTEKTKQVPVFKLFAILNKELWSARRSSEHPFLDQPEISAPSLFDKLYLSTGGYR